MSAATEKRQTLEVDLPFTSNMAIDFLNLAEEKYGFSVVHPGTRTVADMLEGDAADGVDGPDGEDDDEEDENNDDDDTVNVANDKEEETEKDDAKERKRKRGEGRYDLNDPFIDDSEMAWEDQAAATKDGFFVFAGQLVDKNAPPEIEKEDKKKPTKRKVKVDDAKPAKKKKVAEIAPAEPVAKTTKSNSSAVDSSVKEEMTTQESTKTLDATGASTAATTSTTPAAAPVASTPVKEGEAEKPKPKRQRKPKDPNAPPKPRKPRVKKEPVGKTEPSTGPGPEAPLSTVVEVSVAAGTETTSTTASKPSLVPIAPLPSQAKKDSAPTAGTADNKPKKPRAPAKPRAKKTAAATAVDTTKMDIPSKPTQEPTPLQSQPDASVSENTTETAEPVSSLLPSVSPANTEPEQQ